MSDGNHLVKGLFSSQDVTLAEMSESRYPSTDKLSRTTLKKNKLIGFHTKTGVNNEEPVYMMIKSIAPIFDSTNCELAIPNKDPDSHVVKISARRNQRIPTV